MLAYTGWHRDTALVAYERQMEENRKRARRAHRKLNREERLWRDLDNVRALIKRASKRGDSRAMGRHINQWNRLVRALNAGV